MLGDVQKRAWLRKTVGRDDRRRLELPGMDMKRRHRTSRARSRERKARDRAEFRSRCAARHKAREPFMPQTASFGTKVYPYPFGASD